MICAWDCSSEAWVAAGKGIIRPIVVEAENRRDAMSAYCNALREQQSEEYAMEQSMSHLSLQRDSEAFGEDLG